MRNLVLSRAGGLAAALCLGLACAPGGAAAAERYLVSGVPMFAPYPAGIATLDISGGKVTGTLAPPVGDPRAPLPVSGTVADGVLTLTIGSGAEAYTLALVENERGLHRIWEESAVIPGLDPVAVFRPPAGFSEPALALQHDAEESCGLVYGGLTVWLRAQDLAASAAVPAGLADLDVVVVPQQGGTARVKMKDAWSRLRLAARSGDDVSVDIAVPVGAEARMARDIRQVPQVKAVMLPSICGEMALAVVPRAKIADGDKVSEAKLKAYADAMLARLLSGAAPEGGAGQRKFRLSGGTVAAAESGPVYRVTVVGESEATRLAKGNWDQFTLTLQPVATAVDAADTLSLIPAVSDLKGVKKSGPQLPADSAFKPLDDSAEVAAITQRIVSWLAAAEKTRCNFQTSAGFDEPEGSLTCDNAVLDAVSHADDN